MLTFFPAAYGIAETEDDLCAFIAGGLATGEKPASFLLPTRQGGLFRWCLREGMRPVEPMTYVHGRVPSTRRSLVPVGAVLDPEAAIGGHVGGV